MSDYIDDFHDESDEAYLEQQARLNEHIQMINRKRKPMFIHEQEARVADTTITLINHFKLPRETNTKSDYSDKALKKVTKLHAESNLEDIDNARIRLFSELQYIDLFCNSLIEMQNIILDTKKTISNSLINLAEITTMRYDRFITLAKQGKADIGTFNIDKRHYENLGKERVQGTTIFHGQRAEDGNGINMYSLNLSRIGQPDEGIKNGLRIIRGYNIFTKAMADFYKIEELYLPETFRKANTINFFIKKIETYTEFLYDTLELYKDTNADFKYLYSYVKENKINLSPLSKQINELLKAPHVINSKYDKERIADAKKKLRDKSSYITSAPYYLLRTLGEYEDEQ